VKTDMLQALNISDIMEFITSHQREFRIIRHINAGK